MSDRVFYTLGVGFAGGILFRSLFDPTESGMLLFFVVAFACGVVWRLQGAKRGSILLLGSILMLAFGCGAFRFDVAEQSTSNLEGLVNEQFVHTGIVIREPDYRESTVHLYVRLDEYEELVLVMADRFLNVTYGDRVNIEGIVREPESFEIDLGRTFDYPGYLKAHGVRYTIPFASIEVIEHDQGNLIVAHLLHGKKIFMGAFEQAVPEPSAGLGEGVLLGVKRALGTELEAVFRDTGIIHIVVLSGYNVMIVVTIVTHLLSFLFFPRTRMFIAIGIIAGFAIVVGLSATVLRASIMASLLLVARTTGRTYAAFRGLVLAGVVMLLHNPYLLAFDPGFTLSFLATMGLMLLAPFIEAHLHRIPTLFNAREFVTATIATQIFVLPFLLFTMGTFSAVSVMVNVLVLPMVPVAMLLTFITGLAGMVSLTLAVVPGFFAHLSLSYVIVIAEAFARLPFAAYSVPVFPFWVVIVCYACMGICLYYLYARRAKKINDSDSDKHSEEKGDYNDWIIEEEETVPPDARSASGGTRMILPFR